MKWALGLLAAAMFLSAAGFWLLRNPVLAPDKIKGAAQVDAARLKADVEYLAGIAPSRNSFNMGALNRAANFIHAEFTKTGCEVKEQTYKVKGKEFRNILCFFGPEDAPRLVIGAHYDVHFNDNPGADDNASGVAGVLELARMVAAQKPSLAHRLEFVASTLEEQPHFGSNSMGSQVHAASLLKAKVPLKLMVSVEMIGYFSDTPGSQRFPLAVLKPFYPDTGNFIGVVGQLLDRKDVQRVKSLMQSASPLPVYSLNAPAIVPEAGFSDHKSYWDLGLPAVMVTDTAFLRNPNYHRPTDTPDTLDYKRMADVVRGLYEVATRF